MNVLPPIGAAVLLGLAASCQSSGAVSTEDLAWNCSPRLELSTAWQHLSQRYDADGDGRVTRAEYPRGETRFANFDRDADGVLEADDFPDDTYFNGFSHMLLRDSDADGDGAITPEEWSAWCAEMDSDGDGRVVPEEAEAVLGPWTSDWRLFLLSFDQDGDGDFDATDLDLTFRDQDFNGDGELRGKELEGWERTAVRPETEPPAPGEAAPAVRLAYADDPSRTFDLGRAGGKPVALVFGSYT